MSVAAIMMVRDEADIIAGTVAHLEAHVDRVYVLDNLSTDGTSEILHGAGDQVMVLNDPKVAYEQSEKMTQLARTAGRDGYGWVVPVDADEIWTAPSGMRIADYLERQSLDVQVVTAALFDHVPTGVDSADPDPITRIRWRRVEPGVLPKIAARTHPHLTIHPGNHGADYGRHAHLAVPGLRIDHFTWRSPEQYLRKIRNGIEAYRDVRRRDIGVHWRMHDGASDEQITEHYLTWFQVQDPAGREDMVEDPLTWIGDRYERSDG